MSVQLTPSKRPQDCDETESNGKEKVQKIAASDSQSLPAKTTHGSMVYRLLCPASKIDSVIGDGSLISQIRQETGTKVEVEEAVSGCDERVISIIAADKDSDTSIECIKEGGDAANAEGSGDKNEDNKEDIEEIQSSHGDNKKFGNGKAPTQIALIRIFERIAEGNTETKGKNEENNRASSIALRILVLSTQVGCLLGKGGSVIKKMASASGAQIRIVPRDKVPLCVTSSDELVQVTGDFEAVKKALQSISQQLLNNPPRDQDSFPANHSGPSSHSLGSHIARTESFPLQNHPFHLQGALQHPVRPHDGADYRSGIPAHANLPREMVITFKVLGLADNVGSIIGKGGSIVKMLQHETGCEISIQDTLIDSEDRIVVISGPAHPEDMVSPVQDAVLRVLLRMFRITPETKDTKMTARLLVHSNQIGCLLGKGGCIIAEMRKSSGAYIRILGKDQLPKFAQENDEVVQIQGGIEVVEDAVLRITTRLRNNFFREGFSSNNHAGFHDQAPPFPSYLGRREVSPPPGIYSNMGPHSKIFDSAGALSHHGNYLSHDDRPFLHNVPRPRVPFSVSVDNGGPLGFPNHPGAFQRRVGGFGGGNHPAIITNTTMEVMVPSSVVPAIYGEDGECLKQIREISDAKITISDMKPGSNETVIIISGIPEETHAAQSLIQAFVVSETTAVGSM
ncbi:KH domain-containing protein HEN4-like [Impatiens glandulifera]|uniref:KH domain-containing protein HEN4-like n=1 Tax=Impatiens glandulifera TaxID=253017 RepID=UPI001FB0F176|nr:KH domain-containing protein HEN4-like [Impatiens glandulifera]XP_047327015.1 KH domain-containing protein HEN4-like [Impatiens glandulifera]